MDWHYSHKGGHVSQAGIVGISGGSVSLVQTLTGNSGGAVGPTGNNINVVGTGVITVVGNPGTSTLTITPSGAIASSFPTDAGTATPLLGVLNVLGAHGINTSGAGNTVTIAINNAITLGDLSAIATGSNALSATTGDINIASGNFKIPSTSAAGADGVILQNGNRFIHTFGGTLPNDGNTFVGNNSGNFTLTSGTAISNTAVGNLALSALTTGSVNTAVGNMALGAVTTSSNNTAVGESCLNFLTGGNGDNSCVGNGAAFNLQTGTENCVLGSSALFSATTVDDSIVIGFGAAFNILTGDNNIIIGSNAATAYVGAESNNIIINNVGVAAESNVIRIGAQGAGAFQQNACYIAGIVGVTTANSQMVTVNSSTGQLGVQAIPQGANAWTVVTGATQVIAVNNGYISNRASNIAYSLPATSAVGDIFEITNINTALGWTVTQAAGQQIRVGNATTTLGAGGSLSSLALGDSVRCVCTVANTIWTTLSLVGNLTIV